jgi:hypothetical protein
MKTITDNIGKELYGNNSFKNNVKYDSWQSVIVFQIMVPRRGLEPPLGYPN